LPPATPAARVPECRGLARCPWVRWGQRGTTATLVAAHVEQAAGTYQLLRHDHEDEAQRHAGTSVTRGLTYGRTRGAGTSTTGRTSVRHSPAASARSRAVGHPSASSRAAFRSTCTSAA